MQSCPLSPAHQRAAAADPIAEFQAFIAHRDFPCVGAKSAANCGRMETLLCDELGTLESAEQLCCELARFSARYPNPGEDPTSFIAIFTAGAGNEDEFHARLWRQLQQLHDLDVRDSTWAAGVSADPASNDFSFSVASRAFFVVGLHPQSSRLARRSPRPTLVFNFHEQFETMRATGRYAKMQAAIRQRDVALQGDINPVLAQFGDASEAQQYSGKHGGGCPFLARQAAACADTAIAAFRPNRATAFACAAATCSG